MATSTPATGAAGTDRGPRAAVLAAVEPLDGWMTPAQGRRLWDIAAGVHPGGSIAEIGSYRGKSTIVLASAAPAGVTVSAVDPHAGNDRGPQEIHGTVDEGEADHAAFLENLAAAGVSDRVDHIRLPSHDAASKVAGPLDVLYIDGAHRFSPARDDVVRWGAKVAPGGTMLVHDAYSSIGVTLALLSTTVIGDAFRYEGRDGSLARYCRDDLDGRARLANVGRQLVPLGWFARNVLIKAILVSPFARLARLLGHDGETWPY